MVILMALCMTEEPIWLLFSWPTNQKSCWAFNGSGKEWVAISETEREMEGPLQRIRYIWRPSSQLDETVNIDNAPWDEKSLFFFFLFFRYICWISYSACIEGLSSFFYSRLLNSLESLVSYSLENLPWMERAVKPAAARVHNLLSMISKKGPAQRTNKCNQGRFNFTWRNLSIHISMLSAKNMWQLQQQLVTSLTALHPNALRSAYNPLASTG
jgi:hypothetical protein